MLIAVFIGFIDAFRVRIGAATCVGLTEAIWTGAGSAGAYFAMTTRPAAIKTAAHTKPGKPLNILMR